MIISGGVQFDGIIDGDNAIRLALDNEHEDFLYDGTTLVAPSGGATSPIRLYDGGADIASSMPTPEIHSVSGTTNNSSGAYISNKTLYVKSLTAATAEVVVKCAYGGAVYYAKFTANRVTQDKWDIICKPSSIAYNSTDNASKDGNATIQTINLSITGIGIGGTPMSHAINTTIANGNLCAFWACVNKNGTMGGFNQVRGTSKAVTKNECETYAGIYFELRKYNSSNESDYRLCDYETVEIAAASNGAAGKGVSSITRRFKANSDGSHEPDWDESDWPTDPSQAGWSASNRYLWCREQTVYTDGSKSDWGDAHVHSVWGQQGTVGHAGRWYEFKGEYPVDGNALGHETISCTADHGWYIKRGDHFYMLIAADNTSVNTNTSPTEAVNNTNWEYLVGGARQYFIGRAFFGEYADFGSFVINADWMISKKGVLYYKSGGRDLESISYRNFDPIFVNGPTNILVRKEEVTSTTFVNVLTLNGCTVGRSYKFTLTGTTLGATTKLSVRLSGKTSKDLEITGTTSSTDYDSIEPDSSGKITITAKSSGSVKCIISSLDVRPTVDLFIPNYAVDGHTGETYENAAHVRGDITARGIVAEDSQFVTEISAGVTTWRSIDNPLACITIGVDDDGMFFKMTDKYGNLKWDISTQGNGKIASGGFGRIYLKKVSGATPDVSEFSYVTQADCIEYFTQSNRAYTNVPANEQYLIQNGYYVGINNGQFKQNAENGKYVIRLYQYVTSDGKRGYFQGTIDYQFDM